MSTRTRTRPLPRLRLKCPICGGAPRLPRDLRQPVRCGCGALLRVALVPARKLTVTPDWDEAPTPAPPADPPWWGR